MTILTIILTFYFIGIVSAVIKLIEYKNNKYGKK